MKSIFLSLFLITTLCFGQDYSFSIEGRTQSVQLELQDMDISYTVNGVPYDAPDIKTWFSSDLSTVVREFPDGSREIFGFNGKEVYGQRLSPDGRSAEARGVPDLSELPDVCEGALEIPEFGRIEIPAEAVESGCLKVHYDVGVSVTAEFNYDIDATIAYVEGTWAVVSLLYAREGVPLIVTSADIFTTEDPYPMTGNASFDGLYVAQALNQTQGVPGGAQLRHAISIWPGQGGVAYVGGFNPTTSPVYKCAFSSIRNSYVDDINTYSWTVMVQAHEMGHSSGLWHTQDCRYDVNGDGIDGEAIDGCVGSVGDCDRGPLPPNGGTIMSYCHLNSVGINFQEGFDQQFHHVQLTENAAVWGGNCDVGCLGATAISITRTNNSVSASWGGSSEEWIIRIEDDERTVLEQLTTASTSYTFAGLEEQSVYWVGIAPVCDPGFVRYVQTFTLCGSVVQGVGYETTFQEDTWNQFGDADWVWSPGQYKTSGDEDYGFWQLGTLFSPCFTTEGYEYATVEVDLILDLEQDVNKSWDWARMVYTLDGIQWQVLGSYESGFYNADDGYAGPGRETDVWGGSTNGEVVTFTQECSFLTGEPFIIFGMEFFSDSLVWQDGVTFKRFELRGIQDCDGGTVYDTVYTYITDTTYVIDTNLVTVYDTISCDTTIVDPCELFVSVPCVTLYTLGGECATVSPDIISNEPYSIVWSDGSTGPDNTVCLNSNLFVTVTAGECSETVQVEYNVINNSCSTNPRLGNKAELCFEGQTICVPVSQLADYLAQGAEPGACGSDPCASANRNVGAVDGAVDGVKIIPNPAHGSITITGGENYAIYTLEGRKVLDGVVNGSVDVSRLPVGVYQVIVDGITTSVVLY